ERYLCALDLWAVGGRREYVESASTRWLEAPAVTPAKNYRPRCLPRPALEPYPAGCFPPKPPARLLMHSDHRRSPKFQQEYRGTQREILLRTRWLNDTPAAKNAVPGTSEVRNKP